MRSEQWQLVHSIEQINARGITRQVKPSEAGEIYELDAIQSTQWTISLILP